MWKIRFLVTVLLWRPFHAECPGDSFLDLNLYFALVYLFRYYFSKKVSEKNFWKNVFFFWTFDNLVPFSILLGYLQLYFVIYRHDYSFGRGKKRLSSEKFFPFSFQRGLSIVNINNRSSRSFPKIIFLIKPFLISTFNPREALNK